MAGEDSRKLGDVLVKQDVITRDELEAAREREEESGTPWYRQLLQRGTINFQRYEDILRYEFHTRGARERDRSLGDILVEIDAVTQAQLDKALKDQRRSGRLLGNILEDSGLVTRRTISIALARQHDLDFAALEDTPSFDSALEAVPESLARRNEILPVKLSGDVLSVLIVDPQTSGRLGELSKMLGVRVEAKLTNCDNIKEEIASRYAKGGTTTQKEKTLKKSKEKAKAPPKEKSKKKSEPKAKSKKDTEAVAAKVDTEKEQEKKDKVRFEEIKREASGAPVMKLVSTIIEGAANSGATDVHLDPQDPEMRVRYRIDGVLHDVMSIPEEIETAVISRIKILSDIDITETRRPQDGHISMDIGDTEYDIRVASLPTFMGERIVLRLLDQSNVLAGVKDLGLEADDEKTLLRLIDQPYGMILVTGPTGSGKTTSLYASLNQKNVMTESIVTLEDPVEYQLSGINQVEINTDIGMGFPEVLRASLRQDIDVLLVGEIRDAETARIAIRAAMTGHLVFSTMHTNDAPEAISALRNMGVPSYLIASALTAVVGQRLVRTICDNCKKPFTATKTLVQSVGLPASTKKLYRGAGCDECYHTGNRGRTGVFEILEITPEIRKLIAADESIEKISKASKLKTMADRSRQKAKSGAITPEEFLRVVRT
jgi:type IV pilus assembly protein PilB